jgi:TorA-specific chaperone
VGEQADLRSRIYAVLSIAFSEPRDGMGGPGAPHAAALILREATRALGIAVPESVFAAIEGGGRQGEPGLAQGEAGELAAEYSRLFVGPGMPRVYPYESLYRDATGLVMGPSASDVLRSYRRNGMAINPRYRDLPDHIAVELEFMARLCSEEGRAASAGRADLALRLKREEHSFVRAHLATWLPAICERVSRETSSGMYRGFAEFAAIFVQWDRERLAAGQHRYAEAEA